MEEIIILGYYWCVNMSAAEESESDAMQRCASCGKAGSTGSYDIKLKRCNACYLVRYCSVKCQRDHRPKHKKECKKRAAELRDEILFKQPESSHLGDCPICCLPVPIDPSKSILNSCCGKRICRGCKHANQKREIEARLQQKCPFCRKVMPHTDEEWDGRLMKRIEANDPVAICFMGVERYKKGNYNAAFDYWTRAAALGDAHAHYQLSVLYHTGQGVEKDEKKFLHHLTEAAIGGHPDARYNLGCLETQKGQYDRAVKHLMIAAKLGFDPSLNSVKELHKAGHVSKDDFTEALRGYQAAIEETKSPQREESAEFARHAADRERRGIYFPPI